jgi:two-component system, LytTR family, response regulator
MNSTLHLVLIEDEVKSLDLLIRLLDHIPDVVVDATYTDPLEGLNYLRDNLPDLLLLDIRMPGMNGLDLSGELQQQGIYIPTVFISAHDEFILDALRKKAVDYILKPVSMESLRKTIHDFRDDVSVRSGSSPPVLQNSPARELLRVNTKTGFEIIRISDIICLLAEGRYTRMVLRNRKEVLISQNLGYFDFLSNEHHFIRIHRSAAVNPEFVRKLNRITRLCILEGDEFEYKVKVSNQGVKYLDQF